MTPENDKALCDKYPRIFADRGKSKMESCMYWGLAVGDGWYRLINNLCGTIQHHIDWSIKSHNNAIKHNEMVTAVRDGDLSLFNKQFEKIDEQWRKKYIEEILVVTGEDGIREYGMGLRRVPEIIPQLVADQVKEKFGSLRFYHHGGDEYCNGAIELAEALSTCICENCGAPGTVGGRGWIKTLCTPCRTKIDAEQYDIHKDSNE